MSYNPDLAGVADSNSLYIAVGRDGTICRSVDGVRWSLVDSGTHHGQNEAIYYSDGATWQSTDPGNSTPLLDVAFGAGLYVAIGPSTPPPTSALGPENGLVATHGNNF